MKKYYNEKLNKWYTEGDSLTFKIKNTLFLGIPTEEQLKEFGFEEYVEPTPESSIEENLEEKIEIETHKEL